MYGNARPLKIWVATPVSFNTDSTTSYRAESGSKNSNGSVSTLNVGSSATGSTSASTSFSANLNNSLNNPAVNLNSVNGYARPNLTINTPNLSVSIPTGALNTIAASLSATGGAAAAVKAA
jgi:hypothetical protein